MSAETRATVASGSGHVNDPSATPSSIIASRTSHQRSSIRRSTLRIPGSR